MKPIVPPRGRPRVIASRLEWPARRRDLARLARRAVGAPPEAARALATCLVLVRAIALR